MLCARSAPISIVQMRKTTRKTSQSLLASLELALMGASVLQVTIPLWALVHLPVVITLSTACFTPKVWHSQGMASAALIVWRTP